MKRNDIALLIGVAFFTAIFAFVVTSLIFKVPSRSTKVPVAGQITTTFPDIRHDQQYNTIFNDNALDPAVPLQVGSQNDQPFSGSSQ
ncbi:MAG TPA: hypothetical protein VFJ84_01825 [Candidatus Saccharimonadales bacterium]|nr:hypothetical protein [Candidatus Saccharimonadales bacterium]